MKVVTEIGQLHKGEKSYVVALGTFDGLHLGHQEVITTAKREATKRNALLAVFTFSNHPLELIRPELVPVKLLTQQQKYKLLEGFGVDLLIDLPFNKELASLSKDAFLNKLLQLGVSGIVVGENFTYGEKGAGNCRSLAEAAVEYGFSLDVRPLVKREGTVISSTVVRHLLAEGSVREAAALLGRSYGLTGTVAHGQERGRLLGFPTANIELSEARVACPPEGVYAVRVLVGTEEYKGMANVGKNPTFGDVEKLRLEAHLFDFSGNLYGKEITVLFVDKIREQVKFSSIEKLKQQLEQDKLQCRNIFHIV